LDYSINLYCVYVPSKGIDDRNGFALGCARSLSPSLAPDVAVRLVCLERNKYPPSKQIQLCVLLRKKTVQISVPCANQGSGGACCWTLDLGFNCRCPSVWTWGGGLWAVFGSSLVTVGSRKQWCTGCGWTSDRCWKTMSFHGIFVYRPVSVPTLPYGYRAGRKLDQGSISGVITSSSRFSGRIWRLHFGSTER